MLNACHRAAAATAFFLALVVSWAAAAQPAIVKTEVIGSGFRVTLSDGSVKEGTALTGAVLVFQVEGKAARVRIAAVSPDKNNKAVLLHDFRAADTDTPLCNPGPDGVQAGFPLAGQAAPDGTLVEAEPGAFELTCTSGAQGKCVRFGYHPWETGADGRSKRDFFNSCVRMIRADYCGDGRAWTRDGMQIDLWDNGGIQNDEVNTNPTFTFEAGWGPRGAICVAHTRVPENVTLDRLKAVCPRLAAMPTCDEASASAVGALLFNRSR
jgi:hypothetical protein